MMNKRLKQGSVFLAALALTLSLFPLPEVKAASAIDTNAKCSIEFNIGGQADSQLLDSGNEIEVKLYKVANVDESGNFTATEDFKALDLSSVDADQSGQAAGTWADRAKEAKKILKDSKDEIDPKATVPLIEGRGHQSELATGLYLVDTAKVIAKDYTYTFTPYLVSLPGNNYYTGDGASDDWIYDLTNETGNAVGLKPEEHVRYGSLVINKELLDRNNTFGDETICVFQIDITTLEGKTEQKTESLVFNKAGSKSLTVEKIPSGSTVRVEEVYSGAGYKLASQKVVETTIVANDEKEVDMAGETASVSFTNKNSGRINGGHGIKNNFKLDENDQYQYTKPDPEPASDK